MQCSIPNVCIFLYMPASARLELCWGVSIQTFNEVRIQALSALLFALLVGNLLIFL